MLVDRADAGSLVGLRVLVVEDHELVARSLVVSLRIEGLNAQAVTGPSAEDILAMAEAVHPDVVLLDLELGLAGDGRALLPRLVELGAAVVMLSGTNARHDLAECLELGAVDVIAKAEPLERVLEAISGAAGFGPSMSLDRRHEYLSHLREWRTRRRAELAPFEALTPREGDVLTGLCDGMTATEIAEAGFVSVFTVRGHIRSILAKLGVCTQLAATARARQARWLGESGPGA